MAIDLTWGTLPPQETQYIRLSEDDFYYDPKNYVNWIIKNKDTIPHWNEFSNEAKTSYSNILNMCKEYLDIYLQQIDKLPHIGRVENAIVNINVWYVQLDRCYQCSIDIYPSKYIDFNNDFYLVRNEIYKETDPSIYSGIYATFGYTYASSSQAIKFYMPIQEQYINPERPEHFKDVYYAEGYFTFKNDDTGLISMGNFEEMTVSSVFNGNRALVAGRRGYSTGDIRNINLINLCNATDNNSYDGKTHLNDIARPSRSNINSTPNLPTYYSLSGVSGYNLYQIPIDQLDECVSYLNSGVVVSTTSNFLTWIKLLARVAQYAFLDWINNRNDYIISWKMTYYTPTVNLDLDPTINVGATSGIQIANHHITQQYDTIDCGNISIDATSFTDYEPYTYYEIYLPFVGTVPLRADTIAGRTINVKYVVDNVSNESTCIISTIDGDIEQIIHTYECNLGIDIPYKSFDYLGNIRRNASALVGAVASGASTLMRTKSNAYARSALNTTSSKVRQDYLAKSASYENIADSIPQSSSEAGYEQPQCIRSNVGSSLLSSMLPRKPYLIIRRVPMYNVNDSNRLYGRPTLEFATLDNYEDSYVKVRQVRLDGLTCTDEEKTIISEILESGVIL